MIVDFVSSLTGLDTENIIEPGAEALGYFLNPS
jgi:hypothetical protein